MAIKQNVSARPSPSSKRTVQGRFAPNQPLHDLLDGVRELALAAAHGDPERAHLVSKGGWNRRRTFLRRFDLPTAETIRQRLHTTWDRTLDAALAPAGERILILNRAKADTADDIDPELEQDAVLIDDARALRCVALLVGHSPTEIEYEHHSREFTKARNRKQDMVPLRLPSASNIKGHHKGSWAIALKSAGLQPCVTSTANATGRDPAEVLDEFIDLMGFLPPQTYFRDWALATHRPLQASFHQLRYPEFVAAVRAVRQARGVWTPCTSLPRVLCPPLPPIPKRTPYTDADRLQHLQRYATRYLQPGQIPRAKHYGLMSAADPELMSSKALLRHARFQDLCRAAGII